MNKRGREVGEESFLFTSHLCKKINRNNVKKKEKKHERENIVLVRRREKGTIRNKKKLCKIRRNKRDRKPTRHEIIYSNNRKGLCFFPYPL